MSASIFPPESNANVPSDESAFEPLPGGAMELRQFLKAAIRITSALAQLHAKDTIHRSIRPQNIRIHGPSGYVKLLGQAGAYTIRDPQREAAEATEALPYMSPEQTEDMKRPADHRSDLYSLGVVFYEMVSGKLPFQAEDPIGWVQAHLTLEPPPLTVVTPETPQAVSDIVSKLLQKTVEERYQSARGLLIDLETCLVELRAKGTIEPFPLGARDVWHGLRISAKLYGRETEVVSTYAAFERVVNTTKPEIALVSGYSGIGKTSVVLALHKPIVRERGFFLSGKFDQHKRNIPYITIGQAFRDLIRQILTERTSQIELWKKRVIEALGPNAQIIIDIIPQLEELIGKQPPPPELPVQQARDRFNAVFRSFLSVFAKREHPLVLFLDDLQYADWASLDLLRGVITHRETKHLLVLGAYRNNEVSPSHQAIITLEEIKKEGVDSTEIVLKPLEIDHLQHLVADTFHCELEQARALATLLHKKTGGNPFFANQFLAELHHENLVRFDVDNSRWEWDVTEIGAKEFTDDVVELMASKLRRLPGETQAALQLAACIGNEFDVEMLQVTHDKTAEETYQDLDPAVRGEFMLRRGNIYKFMHDRVHQAAYSLIPQEQVNWVHLRIGRLLLERTPESERDDRVFDIVNQFNIGKVYITERDEQATVAALNLAAGRKAKASAAYRSSAGYLQAGLSLVADSQWETDYATMFALHFEFAETEFLNGNFAEAERRAQELIDKAEGILDKAKVYRLLTYLYSGWGKHAQSVESVVKCLSLFGIEISAHPDKDTVQAEFRRIFDELGNRKIEDLIDLPQMIDSEKASAVAILAAGYPSGYFTDQAFIDLLACRIVEISIKHGNAPASAMGYASFGVAACVNLGRYQEGYRFGKLAFDLTEKYNLLAVQVEVCNLFAAMITFWTRHFREDLEYSRIGLKAAVQTGALTYGCFHTLQIVLAEMVMGLPLSEVFHAGTRSRDFITNAKMPWFEGCPISVQRLVENMRGRTSNFSSFSSADFNADEYENGLKNAIPTINFWHYTLKAFARYMSGDFDDALKAAAAAKEVLWSCPAQVPTGEYYFFSALSAAARCDEVNDEARKEHRDLLAAHTEKLRAWSESGPDNYLGKYLLTAGEIARLDGKAAEAMEHYLKAAESFGQSGFVHNQGLAYELAARLSIAEGQTEAARKHLEAARDCYARWEAAGKVRHLEEKYPDLLPPLAAAATS